MNDHGYTLPDTLAALAILSLSVAAATSGFAVLAKANIATDVSAANAVGLKRASLLLDQLLAQAGPFNNRVSGLEGGRSRFTVPCEAAPCGARLDTDAKGVRLVIYRGGQADRTVKLATQRARFAYFGSLTSGEVWPQVTDERQRLRSVGVIDETAGMPLAVATLWIEQPAQCAFDVVAQDCR